MWRCNGRFLLKIVAGIALCGYVILLQFPIKKEMVLPIPPLLEFNHGQPMFLALQKVRGYSDSEHQIWQKGFNGFSPGPTIKVPHNEYVKLVINNQLNESISLILHGVLAPGGAVSNTTRVMEPESSWSPVIPINQRGATCWYHANTSGKMGRQMYDGLIGLLYIDEQTDEQFNLPRNYGVDDIPIIIQDKKMDLSGEPIYSFEEKGFYGNTLFVNGVKDPILEISPGFIRLRLLNASNARRYRLKLDDGQKFKVIANDLGLLPASVDVESIHLAPGERKEILIDMRERKSVSLITDNQINWIERLWSYFKTGTHLLNNQILHLQVTAQKVAVYAGEPKDHFYDKRPELSMTPQIKSRRLSLKHDAGLNSGVVWGNQRSKIRVKQGTIEHWIVTATIPQSFYVQGAAFLIQSINGKPVPAEEQGWKDTVWVEKEVELLIQFNQSSSERYPFLFGSHNAEIADHGVLGQLIVSADTP